MSPNQSREDHEEGEGLESIAKVISVTFASFARHSLEHEFHWNFFSSAPFGFAWAAVSPRYILSYSTKHDLRVNLRRT